MSELSVRTCTRGHETHRHRKPSGGWSDCWLCTRARNSAYHQANREARLEYARAYREAHQDQRRAYGKRYNREYRAALRLLPDDCESKLAEKEYKKAYYRANREHYLEQQRQRRARKKAEQAAS